MGWFDFIESLYCDLSLFVASAAQPNCAAVALFIVMASYFNGADRLSMALGIFDRVLLADSEYRHELEASIEPFKGLLLGLFFMSVGMLTDVAYPG